MDRIKPRPSDMYWKMYSKMSSEVKLPGKVNVSINDDGTFKYENVITVMYVPHNQNYLISCSFMLLNLFGMLENVLFSRPIQTTI